jgi:hypothetical protein
MKLHPAIKLAKKLFKQNGMECLYAGSLSLHVICKEYNERPLIIDLKLSSQEDKAKIDVCEFSDKHSMFDQAMKLHGTVFSF